MANKEMKTIQFPNSETVYEIVDNAAREALAGKQPSGDYATKTELAQGLASKQPTGDYATRTELSQGLAEKQPTGDYATKTELTEGLAEKQPTGDYATTEQLNAHTGNTNNPHGVTKSQVGLENVANERQYSSQNPPPYPVTSVAGRTGDVTPSKTDVGLSNVDNTSDTDKPVSTAQAAAIAEAKQAGTNAQNAIDTHAAKANNPHNVTAAQVGAYVKPSDGIPETDLSAEVQEKLNASGAAENLLQSTVTANRQSGVTEGDMVNLGYALGLEEGKMYTVKYKFNGSDIVATAKYEAPTFGTLEGAELCLCQSVSAEGETMTMSLLLGVSAYNASIEDFNNAAANYGYLHIVDKHQITGDMTYTADENNSSVYPRALQSANAQNAVSVEITAIEPFAEVVADKVKNALTIGDVVFDGSAAKSVDLSEYAKTNGTYSGMSVGKATNADNATNITPNEQNAIALGDLSEASGLYSLAFGKEAIASGSSSTALGTFSEAKGSSCTALGYNALIPGTYSRVMQLGSTSLAALNCQVELTVKSDKRDKTDISVITNALTFLEKLNPVTFVSNDRTKYISETDKKGKTFRKYGMCDYDRVAHALGAKKGERRRCGLLAQDVVAAMQEVYGTNNYANIVNDNFHDLQEKPSDVENQYTLAYANLVPFLIGAIKELSAKIKALESK